MRKGLLSVAAAAILTMASTARAEWLLNAFGHSGRYQVFEFTDDGVVKNFTPLPSPAGAQGAAWPSGVTARGQRSAYASVLYDGHWQTVERWIDTGSGWRHAGIALAANNAEPHGIGPSWVGYDATSAEPWLMYFLVRGPRGPGYSIHRATSSDGVTWTRRGAAIASSNPLSVSTACRSSDGKMVMVVHVYDAAFTKAASHLAVAQNSAGPFSITSVGAQPDAWIGHMWGRAGNALLALPTGAKARIGVPLVSEKTGEVVVPWRQVGTLVYLESPLLNDYEWSPFASIGRNKADISHLSEMPDGSWRAIMTGYGAVDSMLNEYTTSLSAPSLDGPWTYVGDGLRFKPWFAEGQRSTENPHRFSTGIACSQ